MLPIIVSPDRTRYINQEAKIEINITCAYAPTTQGIDVYQNIIPEEKELFASKIPLSNIAFTYTIKLVEIELIEKSSSESKIIRKITLSNNDYNSELGSLYLKEAIDNIVFTNSADYDFLVTEGIINPSSNIYYKLKIIFDLVEEDSGSSDHNRMALSQATSYAVMDYFNQYTYASVTANMIGEIAYTETLTLISTLITAPVLLIGGWTTKGVENVITKTGVKGVTATILKTALIAGKIINNLLIAPIKEVFEEIIKDGFIETWAERQVELWGGTEDMGFWFSALCTSGRETISGSYKGVKTMMKTKSTQIKTINLGLKNSDNLQTWVAQQSGKDYNSDSKFRKDVLKQIEKLHKDGETNILLKTEKKKNLLKIAYSGITTAFKFTLSNMFLGSLTMSSVLSLSGFSSTIGGISASLYGRHKTNIHNAKASSYLEHKDALKTLRAERYLSENTFLNKKSDINQQSYDYAWGELTGELMPSTNIKINAPGYVKVGKLSEIGQKFSQATSIMDTVAITQQLQDHKESFERKMIIRNLVVAKKNKLTAIEVSTTPTSSETARLVVDGVKPNSNNVLRRPEDKPDPVIIGKDGVKHWFPSLLQEDIEAEGIKLKSATPFIKGLMTWGGLKEYFELTPNQEFSIYDEIIDARNNEDAFSVLLRAGYKSSPSDINNQLHGADIDCIKIVEKNTFDDSDLSILEQLTADDKDISLLRNFEYNCKLTIKAYEVNFFDVFYSDNGVKTVEFVRSLDQLVSQIMNDFHINDLSTVEKYISRIWKRIGNDLEASPDQMKLLENEASKMFEKEIRDVFKSDPSKGKKQIKVALTINILKLLFNSKDADGKIIHTLSDTDKIFEGIYNNLNQWKTVPNKPKLGPLYSISVISCLMHTFASAHERSFYFPRRIDRGIDLEVYSVLNILPKVLIDNLGRPDGGYEYSYSMNTKKYNELLIPVINKISGPWNYFIANERNEYDIFGRKYSISTSNDGKVLITSLPTKNFQESETNARVFGELALDVFRNIFETTMDIAEKYRMADVINEIIGISPHLNKLSASKYTEKIMYYLEKYSEIIGATGRKLSKSNTLKIEKLKTINSKIWSDDTQYDLDFEEFKELYESEFGKDKKAPPVAQINSYYSKIFDSRGEVKSGLILEESIDTYYPSTDKVNKLNIPIAILQESQSQGGVTFDSENNLVGSNSLAFTLRKDASGNIEIVHRLIRLEEIDGGKLAKGEVYLNGEYWQLGVIKSAIGNKFKTYKNGMITDITGNALKGRFGFENKDLKDFTSDWYKKQEKTYLIKDGKQYGVKILSFRTTRFGNDYRMIRTEAHLTTMKLKFGDTLNYPSLMFEEMKSFPRKKIDEVIISMDTFENLAFKTNPDRLEIIEEANVFMSDVYSMLDFQMDAFQTHSFLPIDSKTLEKLGAYIDVNGQIVLGPNYQGLEGIFERFIGPNFRDKTFYNNYDNLVYKICSMDIVSNQKNSIFGMKLRPPAKQTRKQWFTEMLNLFQNYESPADPDANKLDKRIHDTIVGIYNKFDLQGFSTESDKYFTDEDLVLADKIRDACEKVFGRFAFQKMYSGQLFAKDGNIRFTIPPWRTFRNTADSRGLSLLNREGLPERSLATHRSRDTVYRVYKAELDFLTSAYRIQLPTDPTLGIDEEFTFIDVLGIPAQLTFPQLSEPSGTLDYNFAMFKTFYQGLSQTLFEDYIPLSMDAIQRKKEAGRQKVLEILIKLYKTQIGTNYLDLLKSGLTPKQITLYRNLGISSLIELCLTTDSPKALIFRRNIYEFLNSRGELISPLEFKTKKFALGIFDNLNQFWELEINNDILKFFEEDFDNIIYSFNPFTIMSVHDNQLHAKSALQSNQDLVLDVLNFIKKLATDTGEELILYTYNRFDKGHGIKNVGVYLPPIKTIVDNVWTGTKAERFYVIDPNNLQEVNAQIPNILGSIFVDDQIIVVRTPNMPEDQCLFAFSLRTGSILPNYLYHEDSEYIRPSANGLKWSDEVKYRALITEFNALIKAHKFFGVHHFKDANDFYQACRLVQFVRDYDFNI